MKAFLEEKITFLETFIFKFHCSMLVSGGCWRHHALSRLRWRLWVLLPRQAFWSTKQYHRMGLMQSESVCFWMFFSHKCLATQINNLPNKLWMNPSIANDEHHHSETYFPISKQNSKMLFKRFLVTSPLTGKLYMCVSNNSGTPKSSILIGISIINLPFLGVFPLFLETSI